MGALGLRGNSIEDADGAIRWDRPVLKGAEMEAQI